jgi:hypothetical protein
MFRCDPDSPTADYCFESFASSNNRSFHIRENQARIERAGTVDVPDAAFAIDQKNAQDVIKRTCGSAGF